MTEKIRRLVDCGFSEKTAIKIFETYYDRKDLNGLESFIRECELLYNDYKEYPKEEE